MITVPANRGWITSKLILAVAVGALSQNAAAQDPARIELSDGSILLGEVIGYRDDKVQVKTAYADKLEIDASMVVKLSSSAAVELLLDDETVVEVENLTVEEGELVLANGSTVPVTTIDIANPEGWEKGEGYKWAGNSGVGMAYNRGNTETDEFEVALNTTFTSVRDRFTARGKFEQDYNYETVTIDNDDGSTSTGQRKVATADNWSIVGKYDYFLEDPDHYFGVNASAEANALSDIDLRTYIGPYYGRKLYKESWLTLDGELGLAYVDTDFATAPDTDYVGVNWNFTGESDILGGDSRLYLTHVGIVNTDDVGQSIFNTTVGLAFPLVMGFEAATEITLNYDGGAAEGKENLDQTYSFRVGYSW
jgi:hypothetical protein